jgi:hypothetical protein
MMCHRYAFICICLMMTAFQCPASGARAMDAGQQQQLGQQRSLLQVVGPPTALSNSDGCLPSIPKCEPGACVTRDIMGVARWACLRCQGNFEPVVDGSGQDNIIECGECHCHTPG